MAVTTTPTTGETGYMAGGDYMALGSGISGIASLWAGFAEADALRAQGQFQKQIAEFNAKLADLQAKDSLERGDKAANQIKKAANYMVGSQRSAYAANGIEVDSGSAGEVQADTYRMATMDAITVRNNAAREAWGFKVQALNYRTQGDMAEIGGRMNAGSSIAVGGLKATSSFANAYAYNKMGSKPKPTTNTTTNGVDYTSSFEGGSMFENYA